MLFPRLFFLFLVMACGGCSNGSAYCDTNKIGYSGVAQALLKHPRIVDFLHGRKPDLIIEDRSAIKNLAPCKEDETYNFTLFVRDKNVEGQAFVFEEIDIRNQGAEVRFSYPVEGLVGRAALEKAGNEWVVRSLVLDETALKAGAE